MTIESMSAEGSRGRREHVISAKAVVTAETSVSAQGQ